MAKILRNICILNLFVVSILGLVETNDVANLGSGDTEAQLLDKEYGVKYASACEGKLLSNSINS